MAGLHFNVIQIKQGFEEWWKAECTTKLKSLFKAVHAFKYSMIADIHRNFFLFAKYRYQWLKEIPNDWPGLIKFLEGYVPLVRHLVVTWSHPPRGSFKCNTDGSCSGNPRAGSMAFCVRNVLGDKLYGETRLLEKCTILEYEVEAIRLGVEYCLQHRLIPLIVETDSLGAEKVLNGVWKVPWLIALYVRFVKEIIYNCQVRVVHTFREGNQLADFFY